jgi:hypothetical protein
MNQITSESHQNLSNVIELAKSKLNDGLSKLETARLIFPQIEQLSTQEIVDVLIKGCGLNEPTAKSYRFMIRRHNRMAREKVSETNNKAPGIA